MNARGTEQIGQNQPAHAPSRLRYTTEPTKTRAWSIYPVQDWIICTGQAVYKSLYRTVRTVYQSLSIVHYLSYALVRSTRPFCHKDSRISLPQDRLQRSTSLRRSAHMPWEAGEHFIPANVYIIVAHAQRLTAP